MYIFSQEILFIFIDSLAFKKLKFNYFIIAGAEKRKDVNLITLFMF